jgi:Tfp pilus assembly protein PilV
MSGRRDLIVVLVAALFLSASILGVIGIAEARREQATQHVVTYEQAPGDWDGDGLPDAMDACPTRPETFNGFQDQDGCPDVVTRTRVS